LRMLRAVRFASTLAFELDAETAGAISRMAGQLSVVSSERITAELRRMLVDPHRQRALMLLRSTGLSNVLWAEIGRPDERAWDRALRVADHLDTPGFALALAAVLGELAARAAEAEALGRRWRLSTDEVRRLTWLITHRDAFAGAEQQPWSRLQPSLTHEGTGDLMALSSARAAIGEFDLADVDFCSQRLQWPADRLSPPPLLTGGDLLAQGVPKGKIYSRLLAAVRDAQLEGEIATPSEGLELVTRLLRESSEPR